MADLSLNNERLRNYLDDKTNEIPVEEFSEVFVLKDKSGTFLEVLDNEMTRMAILCRQTGKRMHMESITDQLLVIARCHVAYREGENAQEWAPLLAAAFKSVWMTVKRVSRNLPKAKK